MAEEVLVDYLIPKVRIIIGDLNPATYRYTDVWVTSALILAVQTLQLWWADRYFITDAGMVSRNPEIWYRTPVTDSIIEKRDEPVIALMTSFLLLEGSLENSSYSYQNWRDAEVSFSNVESGKVKDLNVRRLWDQLQGYLIPPTKRLARAFKGSLPGYKGNSYERDTEY